MLKKYFKFPPLIKVTPLVQKASFSFLVQIKIRKKKYSKYFSRVHWDILINFHLSSGKTWYFSHKKYVKVLLIKHFGYFIKIRKILKSFDAFMLNMLMYILNYILSLKLCLVFITLSSFFYINCCKTKNIKF